MIAVTSAPTMIPRIGFLPRTANAFAKIGASVYGATELDINVNPTNSSPTPIQTSPTRLSFFFFENIRQKEPIATTSGAKKDGCSTFIASPREFKETIHAVIVVPMFAPMMTPTAWVRFRIPAFTKPTTMTVVAPLLCRIAVIRAPSPTARSRLSVTILRNLFSLLPADFCMPSPIMLMPYRNIPRPPRKLKILSRYPIFIMSSPFSFVAARSFASSGQNAAVFDFFRRIFSLCSIIS